MSNEQKTIKLQLEQMEQQQQLEMPSETELDFKQLDNSFPTPVYIENERKDIFYESVSNKIWSIISNFNPSLHLLKSLPFM